MKNLGLMFAVVAALVTTGVGFAQAATSSTSTHYEYSSRNDTPGNGSPNKVDGGR